MLAIKVDLDTKVTHSDEMEQVKDYIELRGVKTGGALLNGNNDAVVVEIAQASLSLPELINVADTLNGHREKPRIPHIEEISTIDTESWTLVRI